MTATARKPSGSAATYRAREQQTLDDLALQTWADRNAPEAERLAARERLMCAKAEPDFKRLDTNELRQFCEAIRTAQRLLSKARGEVAREQLVTFEPEYVTAVAKPSLLAQLGIA